MPNKIVTLRRETRVSSHDHLPPTPYSYDPSTPCPIQPVQTQPQASKLNTSSDNNQVTVDNQNKCFAEISNIHSPDHMPPTPYSSDPPTPYSHNCISNCQGSIGYSSPEHEPQKVNKSKSYLTIIITQCRSSSSSQASSSSPKLLIPRW